MLRSLFFVFVLLFSIPALADADFKQATKGLRIGSLTGQTLVGVTRDSSKVFSVYLAPNKDAYFKFSSGSQKKVKWRRQGGNVICFKGLVADKPRQEVCKLTDKKGRGMDWMTIELYKENGKTFYRKATKGEKNGSSQIVYAHAGNKNVKQSSYIRDLRKWAGHTVVGRTFKDKEAWVAQFKKNGTLTFVFGSGKTRTGTYRSSRDEICMTFPSNPNANGCRRPSIKDGKVRWEDAKNGNAISEVVYMAKSNSKAPPPKIKKKKTLELAKANKISRRFFGTILDGKILIEQATVKSGVQFTNTRTAKPIAELQVAPKHLDISTNGRNIAILSSDAGDIVLTVDAFGNMQSKAFELPASNSPTLAIAIDDSARYLARTSWNEVQIFDLEDTKRNWTQTFENSRVSAMEFINGADQLVIGRSGGAVSVWDFKQQVIDHVGSSTLMQIDRVAAVASTSDFVIVGELGNEVKVTRYSLNDTGKYLSAGQFTGSGLEPYLAVSGNGEEIFVPKDDANVIVLDANSLKIRDLVKTKMRKALSRGIARVDTISNDGDVLVWASNKKSSVWARNKETLKRLESQKNKHLDVIVRKTVKRLNVEVDVDRKRRLDEKNKKTTLANTLWNTGDCDGYVAAAEGLPNAKEVGECELAAVVRRLSKSFDLALKDQNCEAAQDMAQQMQRASDEVRVKQCYDDRQFALDTATFTNALETNDCETVRSLAVKLNRPEAGDACEFNVLLTSESVRRMYLGAVKLETKQDRKSARIVYEAIMDKFPEDDLALDAATRLMSINDQEIQEKKQAETEAALAAAQRSINQANAEADRARKEANAANERARKETEKARAEARAAARRAENARADADRRARQAQQAAQRRQQEANRQNSRCAHVYIGQVFNRGIWKYRVLGVNRRTASVSMTTVGINPPFSKEESCSYVR